MIELNDRVKKIYKAVYDKLGDTSRFKHTIGVLETASKLAKIHNADVEKVQIAALLHDYAKLIKYDELEKYIIIIDKTLLNEPKPTWHAYVASYIAENEFNIKDKDILNAIYYHTSGRSNMSLIEEIIFISDFIEPNRFKKENDVYQKAYELTFKNLKQGIAFSLYEVRKYLESKGNALTKNNLDAYNEYIKYL